MQERSVPAAETSESSVSRGCRLPHLFFERNMYRKTMKVSNPARPERVRGLKGETGATLATAARFECQPDIAIGVTDRKWPTPGLIQPQR